MNSERIQTGTVYHIRHAKVNDRDFEVRYPAYDGPGLVLEVSHVHGAYSGRKRADGSVPKNTRRRGVIRYMDQHGEERIVGAEMARALWDDERTAQTLVKLNDRLQAANPAAKPNGSPPPEPEVVKAAPTIQQVMDRLRVQIDELDQQFEEIQAERERLEHTLATLEGYLVLEPGLQP